jgi:CHAD domain-containing protein
MKTRSKAIIFRIPIIIACFLFILGFEKSVCEEQGKPRDKNDSSGITLEQALKNYDTQKQKDQEELFNKLNSRLIQATENWINTAKKDRADKLNTRFEQNWEKLALSYPVSPVHYEYELRGFKYYVDKSEVVKSDSLTSPYKAMVIVKEELYAEKNHSPNISNASPYFYTVITNYTLNFEHKNEKFILVNSDKEIVSMENKCPDEIKRLRL